MMITHNNGIRLSVLLITYNHAKHIHQSLKSLFRQAYSAPVELVIADDGSTDETLTIIRTFEGKDSRFHFKYLDSSSNVGITRNYQRAFAACTGEYVAVLEGDDYWIHPLKLQRQIDFLDAHWECDLCSVNYFIFNEDLAQFTVRTSVGIAHRFVSARELIADNLVGNFSTCMYRKDGLSSLPIALFDITSYDWIVNICLARKCLIGFLEAPMSVYRIHSNGVWSSAPQVDKLKKQLDVIPAYDALTDFVFHAEFEVLASRLKHSIKASQIENSFSTLLPPLAREMPKLVSFMPPVLITLMRAVTPPILKRVLGKVLRRSRTI